MCITGDTRNALHALHRLHLVRERQPDCFFSSKCLLGKTTYSSLVYQHEQAAGVLCVTTMGALQSGFMF